MADPKTRVTQGPLIIRAESGKLFAPDSIASLIENFVETEEGTLRSISGPTYVVPPYEGVEPEPLHSFDHIFGIFHGRLKTGQKDILLMHAVGRATPLAANTNSLWIFEGWRRAWSLVFTFSHNTDYFGPSTPTQFELTPFGIVVLPAHDRRVFIYDENGSVVPFGYSDIPGSPDMEGPMRSRTFMYNESATSNSFAIEELPRQIRPPNQGNNNGFPLSYSHDGNIWSEWRNVWTENTTASAPIFPDGTQMHTAFGRCRVGTIETQSGVDAPSWLSPNPLGYEEDGTPWFLDDATIAAAKRQNKTSSAAALAAGISPGQLLECAYEGATQWIDRYGNLSPISPRTETLIFEQQTTAIPRDSVVPIYEAAGGQLSPGGGYGSGGTTNDYYKNAVDNDWDANSVCPPDKMQKQFLWRSIDQHEVTNGAVPTATSSTVGRLLLRTRDLLSSGTTSLFIVPPNAQGGVFNFATIPDNISTLYPDNTPDAWLTVSPVEVDPMISFNLCRMALGRMWYANADGDPGILRWSLPGRFATLGKDEFVYPDPMGGPVTALWAVPAGLLVFTETSTFLATDTSAATGLSYQTLSTTAGCVAASSVATIPTGVTIWLGQDGFYAYGGGEITYFSEPIRKDLRLINKARQLQAVAAVDSRTGEYRCWVAMSASLVNDMCWVYDYRGNATGWRRRTDLAVQAVAVTRDHRAYMVAAGTQNQVPPSVLNNFRPYILDHSHSDPSAVGLREADWSFETTWLLNENSYEKQTAVTVYFWMRETTSTTFRVQVFRDWRKVPLELHSVSTYSISDPPPFWGSAVLGSDGTTYRNRRPYWSRAEIYVPSCEVFKIRAFTNDAIPIEFIGLSFDFIPHPSGGARVQP